MDSVDVLRVFWRNRWLFVSIFLLVFGSGWFVVSSKNVKPISPPLLDSSVEPQVYVFGVLAKKVGSALPALNKPMLLGLIDELLHINKLESAYSPVQNPLNFAIDTKQILPNLEPVLIMYQAESKQQAQRRFEMLQREIDALPLIVSYQQYYKDLLRAYKVAGSMAQPNPQHSNVAELALLQEVVDNGLLLWIEPTEIAKSQAQAEQKGRISGITPRRAAVFLLLSAFVLASLGVFLLEFVRVNRKRIAQ